MARGFNALPMWALVLIVIGIGVGLYLQRKAEQRRVDDAVVVNSNEIAPRPAPKTNPHAPPARVGDGHGQPRTQGVLGLAYASYALTICCTSEWRTTSRSSK